MTGYGENLKTLLRLPLPRLITDAVAAAGGEARPVGGVVRDILAGADPAAIAAHDMDMATTLPPDDAVRVLIAAGLKVIPTGIAHGTVTVIRRAGERRGVELTSLREDVETDGRHARVRFGRDWHADALRRDFTINTMSVMAGGRLYDPFDGAADLAAGRVRFVGDAAARIREDYLRIMRFFRFHARFGRGAPDGEAMQAIAEHVQGLERISGERMAKELCGILWEKNPAVIENMRAVGVDRAIAPQGFFDNAYTLAQPLIDFALPPLAWLGFIIRPDDWREVATRLRFSNIHSAILAELSRPLDPPLLERADWHKAAWYQMSAKGDGRALAARYILSCARSGRRPRRAVRQKLRAWQKPPMPLFGRDLRAVGIPAGRGIGAMLKRAERVWVASHFTAGKAELIKAAQSGEGA